MTQPNRHCGKLAALLILIPCLVQASVDVDLIWNPSPDASVTGYYVYWGAASATYTNRVTVGAVTNATVRGLREGTTYYFAATAFTADALESDFSNEAVYTSRTNVPPKIGPIADLNLRANIGLVSIALTGISSGDTNETQTVTITATSSNPAVVGIVSVSYANPATTGTLTITTRTNVSGKATITVLVSDGIATTTRPFQVQVRPAPGGKPTVIKETFSSVSLCQTPFETAFYRTKEYP